MKPCFHFGMKFLFVVMVISLFLGTTLNAQEITPTVDLNAYTPQGKEKLKELKAEENVSEYVYGIFGYHKRHLKITGWARGNQFVDGSPIRIEFENKEQKGMYEGIYHIQNEQSFIDGRYVEKNKYHKKSWCLSYYEVYGTFFIHQEQEGMNTLYARSKYIEINDIMKDYPTYSVKHACYNDNKYVLIRKKLSDGWLQQLKLGLLEDDGIMKPHDTIYRITETYDDDDNVYGKWNIVFKNGDRYEGSLNSYDRFYEGKYYFANGDVYEGSVHQCVVGGTTWDNGYWDKISITFSDGEHVEKGWLYEESERVAFARETLCKESSSATDLRNRLRAYLVEKASKELELETKRKEIQQQFEKYKAAIRQKKGKYATAIEKGELVVGMTQDEVITALCVHVLTKVFLFIPQDDNEKTEQLLLFVNNALNRKESFFKTIYELVSQYGETSVWSYTDLYLVRGMFRTLPEIVSAYGSNHMYTSADFRLVSGKYGYLTFTNGKLYGFQSEYDGGWKKLH